MIFYSVHFNRPDFIEIQKKCIDKIGAKLVVIDNSGGGSLIKDECEKLAIENHNTGYERIGDSSYSHGMALNKINDIIDYKDDWCIIDHDFFPTSNMDFDEFDLIGILETREVKKYLWPGFMAGRKEISLDGIDFLPCSGADTGAGTTNLLERNYKIKYVAQKPINGVVNDNEISQKIPILYGIENYGIHYLNGSGWMGVDSSVVAKKNMDLLKILNIE